MTTLLTGGLSRGPGGLVKDLPFEVPEQDAINPAHYKDIVPGYQYFDLMDFILKDWKGSQAHALGNAYKYLMRLGKKDDMPQEIDKAIWYLERLKKDVKENGKL